MLWGVSSVGVAIPQLLQLVVDDSVPIALCHGVPVRSLGAWRTHIASPSDAQPPAPEVTSEFGDTSLPSCR
jgi:hypothetical protein